MCGRLARREADHMGFYSAIGTAQQRSAEPARLIIGVSCKAEQTRHLLFPSSNLKEYPLSESASLVYHGVTGSRYSSRQRLGA